MKWLPGGWQRASDGDPQQGTAPRGTVPNTVQVDSRYAAPEPFPASGAPVLGPHARDIDVSAASFRLLMIGGGTSGLLTVVCAASLADKGSSFGTWVWQLVFGVIFVWFVTASRGMLRSRGFLIDHSGFYPRTQGEIVGVPWAEVAAIGVGTLPWIQHKRLVHPERRRAVEIYPADPGFISRHPEFDRWRVDEPPPMPGLPSFRYRFHLPPVGRIPRDIEHAVQGVAPRKWIGQYERKTPAPPAR